MIEDLHRKTRQFEDSLLGQIDQLLEENKELKIKHLELIKQIRDQREAGNG
jgi:hypothetical protein